MQKYRQANALPRPPPGPGRGRTARPAAGLPPALALRLHERRPSRSSSFQTHQPARAISTAEKRDYEEEKERGKERRRPPRKGKRKGTAEAPSFGL
jgi:hypothetical protein